MASKSLLILALLLLKQALIMASKCLLTLAVLLLTQAVVRLSARGIPTPMATGTAAPTGEINGISIFATAVMVRKQSRLSARGIPTPMATGTAAPTGEINGISIFATAVMNNALSRSMLFECRRVQQYRFSTMPVVSRTMLKNGSG
ncbi:hypothetical protein Bbelb_094250 [Branchiostoma belcheri]|nr:hypothetical protein Bbelb_094250 [Branchiostoma belcheri]